jgi:hypothetical protein
MTSIQWFANEVYRAIDLQSEGKISATIAGIKIAEAKYKAKEMHKQEMIKFANDFWNWAKGGDFDISDAEQYYQETFVSKESGMSEKPNNHINSEIPNVLSSQTEISDEEIEKAANYFYPLLGEQSKKALWVNGCKWYREQLKQPKKD